MDDSAVVSPPSLAGPLRLEPFRALHLDPSKVGDPASARLYARPYRGIAARVDTWIERGDIVADTTPALYLHEYRDEATTVRGIVGALDVTQLAADPHDAAVVPHEGVHPPQVRELARRMREMRLNPAPILLAYHATAAARALLARVRTDPPTRQYIDRGGQHHRIWVIRDPTTIARLNHAWQSSRALIADGHHRYAAYVDSYRAAPSGPCGQGLAMLIDQTDTPLRLGAIHRVLDGVRQHDLLSALRSAGATISDTDGSAANAPLDASTLAVTDGTVWRLVTLPIGASECAVDYLHGIVIPGLRRPPHAIHYEHSVGAAVARTGHDHASVILLPQPTLDRIWPAADAGRLLPEKTTSFQPKPHAGVFMRSMRDAQPVH